MAGGRSESRRGLSPLTLDFPTNPLAIIKLKAAPSILPILKTVRKRRKQLKLTQVQLAEQLGVSGYNIRIWENGELRPDSSAMKALKVWLKQTAPDTSKKRAKSPALGRRIVEKRRTRGMSQSALSKVLGVSPTTLANWEKNAAKPNKSNLERLNGWLTEKAPKEIHLRYKIGELLKRKRMELGISQHEASRQLGVDSKSIRDWEKGKFVPRRANVKLIEDWLRKPTPEKTDNKLIISRLKAKRRSLGISQTKLAHLLGVGKNRVYEWEKGARPRSAGMQKVCRWISESTQTSENQRT